MTDHATYENGSQPATGFAYVFVGGELVLENDRVRLEATPGAPIRFPASQP